MFFMFTLEMLFIMERAEKSLHVLVPTKSWMDSCGSMVLR